MKFMNSFRDYTSGLRSIFHRFCYINSVLLLQSMLEPATVKAVRSLLPEYANGSLASLCTWPDDIKWMYKWHWTHAIHYIDTPDFLCRYNYDRNVSSPLFVHRFSADVRSVARRYGLGF